MNQKESEDALKLGGGSFKCHAEGARGKGGNDAWDKRVKLK